MKIQECPVGDLTPTSFVSMKPPSLPTQLSMLDALVRVAVPRAAKSKLHPPMNALVLEVLGVNIDVPSYRSAEKIGESGPLAANPSLQWATLRRIWHVSIGRRRRSRASRC